MSTKTDVTIRISRTNTSLHNNQHILIYAQHIALLLIFSFSLHIIRFMIDQFLNFFMQELPAGCVGFIALCIIIAIAFVILGKGADILVDEAVLLSKKWEVPKMLIGATIVSLGTTLPEVTVSVMAAIKGAPGLALGNAVGSIICDTGLILGILSLIAPLPFCKNVVNKQGWIQFSAGLLIVIVSYIFRGHIPQFVGFVFLGLLALYIFWTISSGKKAAEKEETSVSENLNKTSSIIIILKLIFGVVLVIASSKILIPAVQECAIRCHIPDTVIASTLVAFGTSLPELVTGITSARKGHGDLAIGNVIGADILNVLFVTGAAAAVTKGGLTVDSNFFTILFPTMMFVLIVFRGSVMFSKNMLKRPAGAVLLTAYLACTIISYVK